METLQMLGTALGLGALAGINLYLTVFAAGLAIQQGWVTLAPQYSQLGVLGDPVIVAIAGLLYFIQFFADKIPWVDSLWDVVHTVIRPVGAAFLAVKALGGTNPVFDIVVVLLAGGVGLTTHGLKAGTRLVANTSPEPFSNIALSVTEDATVLGGLALVHKQPVLALGVVVVAVAAILYLAPKLARSVCTTAWLVGCKLNSRDEALPAELPKALSPESDILLHKAAGSGRAVEWAVPCIATGSKRIPSNASGYLVALQGDPTQLFFVSKSRWLGVAERLDLEGYKTAHESKLLCENLVFYAVDRRPKLVFYFDRSKRSLAAKLAETLRERLSAPVS